MFNVIKNAACAGGIFREQLLAFLLGLALLVSNAAAGLASRLAGGLALAAAAVLCALAKVSGFNGLDMFHFHKPPKKYLLLNYSISYL